MIDFLAAYFSRLVDVWSAQLSHRDVMEWVLFFAPLIFLEIPQYYLPLIGVTLAHKLGFPRRDRRREEAFLRRAPMLTVVVAGRNEEGTIEKCIRSLLDQEYPRLEIIIVDDSSEDDTYKIASRFAKRGLIRVIRNREPGGRAGRPMATNIGTRLANGELILSVDADTTFDRNLIRNVVAAFADPLVGVVAGNVLVRNSDVNLLTRIQELEYITAIDLHKRWTDYSRRTLQASGAIGAFRRSAVMEIGGWDPELAEDGDISLRMVKAGWKVAFAPEAVGLTDVPEDLRTLCRQRGRWDRGGLRAYFHKHGRLLLPSVSSWSFARSMWGELIFGVVLPLCYPIYMLWLATHGVALFLFVMLVCWLVYGVLAFLPVLAAVVVSERVDDPRRLWWPALLSAPYRGLMRWVKIRALVLELLRIDYEDSFLPESAWRNARRF